MPKLTFGRIALLFVGIFVAAVIFLPASKPDPKEKANQQAAIAAIRSRYAPADQLVALNPDPQSVQWIAVAYPACDSKDGNCWQVDSYVDVMPQAEKKTIKSEWLIDLSTGKDQPQNTEARTMYALVSSPNQPPLAAPPK